MCVCVCVCVCGLAESSCFYSALQGEAHQVYQIAVSASKMTLPQGLGRPPGAQSQAVSRGQEQEEGRVQGGGEGGVLVKDVHLLFGRALLETGGGSGGARGVGGRVAAAAEYALRAAADSTGNSGPGAARVLEALGLCMDLVWIDVEHCCLVVEGRGW